MIRDIICAPSQQEVIGHKMLNNLAKEAEELQNINWHNSVILWSESEWWGHIEGITQKEWFQRHLRAIVMRGRPVLRTVLTERIRHRSTQTSVQYKGCR